MNILTVLLCSNSYQSTIPSYRVPNVSHCHLETNSLSLLSIEIGHDFAHGIDIEVVAVRIVKVVE